MAAGGGARDAGLRAENEALRAENEALRAGYEALRSDHEAVRVENEVFARQVEELRLKIGELERRLKVSSRTSSSPPSKDSPASAAEATKSRAERRAEQRASKKDESKARRRGKQPGAPGQHLAAREVPDHVTAHEPPCCEACGADLSGAPQEGVEVRQVFDIPDPRLLCNEHRSIRRRCLCGKLNAGVFPPEASAPTSYGPNVRAAALYLLHGQHLSVQRCAEALSEMLGVEVSQGFIASLVPEAARRLEGSGFLERLRERLLSSSVIHVDETSDQVSTRTWWLHVAATDRLTYLYASPTRGKAAPDAAGVLGRFKGVMVHDRLAMYFNYNQAEHGICAAHLIRDLASVAAVDSQKPWAEAMSALLREMIAATNTARDEGRRRLEPAQLEGFLARYDEIVEAGLGANPEPPRWRQRTSYERESFNLARALKGLKTEATRFACDLSVAPTNNEAERSLRMAKLHAKISGCFQSERHAEGFATVRSYIGTARKHGVGALKVLSMLFNGDVWMPPATT